MTLSEIRPGQDPAMPRELVLASAGTGKTYTLSGRIIALLAAGVPPDTLLASTFTRKAAGEILNRVLARIAEASLSRKKAEVLARETRTPGIVPSPEPSPDFFFGLLNILIRDLHRLSIGTLDSFFIRVARGFSPDLGLPPAWVIVDEPGARRLEAEALQVILAGSSREEMVELVRMAMRGDWGRGVHSRLLAQLRSLRELLHQAEDSGDGRLWGPGDGNSPASTPEERETVEARIARASLPMTRAGKPHSRFAQAVADSREALLAGDWERFCGKGLAAKLLQGEVTYYQKEIPQDLMEAVRAGMTLAARDLTRDLRIQAGALEGLTRSFDETVSRLQRARGALRFHDVTFLLGGPDPVGNRADVWYRLDQRAQHLLLDEFQDTALEQWEALSPLAWELLSGHLGDRSAMVVADPKQSIYGWRGADPLLVRRVGSTFSFRERTLERSYRSSKWVLELVNRVFGDLRDNPVWGDSEEQRLQADAWVQAFIPHRAARDLPGYVRVMAGPAEERMTSSDRPRMMAWAAERVAELAGAAPGATIGVLVRQNRAVARLIMELRKQGVEASEEGATTLEDSPAVSTVLALLQLADHPGDSVSAYQVRHSPLGRLLGDEGENLDGWASRITGRVRETLCTEGYGRALTRWVRQLGGAGQLSHRDMQRLLQLAELAFRWDRRATLRPGDFVRFARSERMEAPSEARVRVMTVHQAKGLEFDQVVLPEMDVPLTRGQGRFGGVLPLRNPDTGRVIRILPRLPGELRPLVPELEEAARQEAASELRDALGVLYVALTRACHALHIFLAETPDPEPDKLPRTFAGLIRGGLNMAARPLATDQILLELGAANWARTAGFGKGEGEGERAESRAEKLIPQPTLARRPVRSRNLHHRTPSSLAGGEWVDLKTLLSLDREEGLQRGSLMHRWLQDLIWWEDWNPDRDALLTQAQGVAPGMHPDRIREHLTTLERWLEGEEVRKRLSRPAYPPGSEVETEYSFALSLGGEFFTGQVDRMVIFRRDGIPHGAEVLDFKTDAIRRGDEATLARKVREYEPQVILYRKAVSRLLKLDEDRVRGTLIFLDPGRIVDLPNA